MVDIRREDITDDNDDCDDNNDENDFSHFTCQGMKAEGCLGEDKKFFPCNTEPCDMQVAIIRS